jgi:hypothetical protein
LLHDLQFQSLQLLFGKIRVHHPAS